MNNRNVLGVIIGITLATAIPTLPLSQRSAEGIAPKDTIQGRAAPIAISGSNVYITWWTNNTANKNEDVMFRASNDGGATFGDKINLSNTTNADSWKAEIAEEGDNVVVSWWETNQTSDTPVTRISTDAGQTFGPILMLATNGTIGEAAEKEPGSEATAEEE
jgi:hypothetical protein